MKKNDGNSEDFAKLKNLKNRGKTQIEDFQLLWWRDPPYKNDDSDTAYNCRRVLRIKFFINFFTLRVLFFID